MKIAILIFTGLVALLSLCTLIGTGAEMIIKGVRSHKTTQSEKKKRCSPECEAPAPIPDPAPIQAPPPVPSGGISDEKAAAPVILPPPMPQIDATEADLLLPDELALRATVTEQGGGSGYRACINIGEINRHFAAEDTVTLQILRERGLIEARAMRLKILADGVLDKPLTVKADAFSVQAIKMIELTGGRAVLLID